MSASTAGSALVTTDPAGLPLHPAAGPPGRQLAQRRAARRRRVRRRRVLPVRRRPHRGRAARRARARPGEHRLARLRQPGRRLPDLRQCLRGLGIPPTVLLNTDVYDEAPAVLDAARRAGAEIVGHGRSNSDSLSQMTPDAERAYLDRRRRPHPRARGRGARRLVEPVAQPHPGDAEPVGRDRISLPARPAPATTSRSG